MTKKISIIFIAAMLLCSLVGSYRAGAITALDGNTYGQQFKMPIIVPNDDYLYLQNNDSNITDIIKKVSVFTVNNGVMFDQIWDGQQIPSDGTTLLASEEVPQGVSIQSPGGVMYLRMLDGISLRDVTDGIIYFAVSFTDSRPPVAFKLDYSNCLAVAGSNLESVECRPIVENYRLVYVAYRNAELVTAENNPDPTPTPSTTTDEIDDTTGENDDTTSGIDDDIANTDNTSPNDDISSDSQIIPSIPEISEATPTMEPPRTIENAYTNISSDKNVKNTNSDTNSAALGAVSTDSSDILPPPSAQKTVETESAASASSPGAKSYEWWALLPLVTLIAALIIAFATKRKQVARFGL